VGKQDNVPKQTISLFAARVLALAQIEGLTEPEAAQSRYRRGQGTRSRGYNDPACVDRDHARAHWIDGDLPVFPNRSWL